MGLNGRKIDSGGFEFIITIFIKCHAPYIKQQLFKI